MPGPADAHDAGVYGTGVERLVQLMLMMLGSIDAWPS